MTYVFYFCDFANILKTIWLLIVWQRVSVMRPLTPIIHVGHNDLDFHGPVMLFHILRSVSWMNVILWDDESVRCNVWPYNKCRLHWHIFHGLVILPHIFATIVSYFGEKRLRGGRGAGRGGRRVRRVTACQYNFFHFEPSQSLDGTKTGDPEKKHLTTHKQNLACVTCHPS